MVASSMTPPAISEAPKVEEETTGRHLDRVGTSARWGLIMTLINLVYADIMVARQLPPDPRQDSWLMMRSPLPTYLISLCYVLGVTHVGPWFMGSRKPLVGLRPLMVAYNTFQVVFSAWLLYEIGMGGWFTGYNLLCQSCDFTRDAKALRMLHASYWYYLSKFVDFLDTVFFVLTKKYEHISPLHVVHHSLMPVNMWYGVRYQPGGHSSLMGLLNSFVHVLMYTYYLLAAMGPRVRPYLWWKKYLTSLQMLQFVTVMLHSVQLAFRECPGVPPQVNWWICGNASMFLLLFADFYRQAYSSRKAKRHENGKPSLVCGNESNGVVNGISNGTFYGISKDTPNNVSRREGVHTRQHRPQEGGRVLGGDS
ncbi:very long chain fatty acid elongase 7-like [Panulirus ornatus]|uniref:very long chain fatty acid elongase 7-like n=1 Tax=Panulirus ornatus TaxID=150431 RepID=UPI003A86698A